MQVIVIDLYHRCTTSSNLGDKESVYSSRSSRLTIALIQVDSLQAQPLLPEYPSTRSTRCYPPAEEQDMSLKIQVSEY